MLPKSRNVKKEKVTAADYKDLKLLYGDIFEQLFKGKSADLISNTAGVY